MAYVMLYCGHKAQTALMVVCISLAVFVGLLAAIVIGCQVALVAVGEKKRVESMDRPTWRIYCGFALNAAIAASIAYAGWTTCAVIMIGYALLIFTLCVMNKKEP